MKSFIEKLNNKKDIKIVESLSGNISWADEGNSMVVSTPLEIWSIIKLIPAFLKLQISIQLEIFIV